MISFRLCIWRNPKDVLVSMYHLANSWVMLDSPRSFEGFFWQFLDGKGMFSAVQYSKTNQTTGSRHFFYFDRYYIYAAALTLRSGCEIDESSTCDQFTDPAKRKLECWTVAVNMSGRFILPLPLTSLKF